MALSPPHWTGSSVLLLNATVPDIAVGSGGGGLRRQTIRIADGKIEAIGASLAPLPGEPVHDCGGGLVLPALVDVHTHLDKGHIWTRQENPDGTFIGALRAVSADRAAHWTVEEIRARMDFALRCAYAHGTAAIRTHLDSADGQRQAVWPIFAELREEWRGRIELQAVALIGPDQMLDRDEVDRVAQFAAGFDGVLGGAIAAHPQVSIAMRNIVAAAGDHGVDLDLHCDETLDPGAHALSALAEEIIVQGFTGQAQAGHCCSLSMQEDKIARRTIDLVAQAGIGVVALPMCNLYLQDRRGGTPRYRGVTLVSELAAAGIAVSTASDNTRDPFFAYGDLDLLEAFRELARIAHIDHPTEHAWSWLASVSSTPARKARFAYSGQIAVGEAADLVIVGARNWSELHSRSQHDRTVVRQGRLIDTTLPSYHELDAYVGGTP